MRTVNMHEAKTHLYRLVEQASKGEPFIIARAGKPLVKVVPVRQKGGARMPKAGFMKGSAKIIGDIVSPMHDVWNLSEWNFPK